MAKATKKKAPSRIRYEASHPTVTCRVSKEIYDRLEAVKKAEGKSFADVLKIGLNIVEPLIKKAKEARDLGWDEGFQGGYSEAERLYKVTYSCSVCGEMVELTDEEEKKAAAAYMTEAGGRHSECH